MDCERPQAYQAVGLPQNLNLFRSDSHGLPLRDEMIDVALLRESFPGSKTLDVEGSLPEAMRLLRPGALCCGISLNFVEGDLGALVEAMMAPDDGAARQRQKELTVSRLAVL
jgi:hypothetical protein